MQLKAIDKVVPPPYRAPTQVAVAVASFATPGGAAKGAASKAPTYVPKAAKAIKDVFAGAPKKHYALTKLYLD